MGTYKVGDTVYDVSLLDQEAQGLFGLLKDAMVKVQISNNDVQLYQAAAQQIKALFEDRLTDEAITEDAEEAEIVVED
jgi:hypothetical protein